MKVLVTGAAGFIGLHLVERLISDGYQVVALDNLYSSDGKCLEQLVTRFPRQLQWIHGDIRDVECVSRAMAGCSVVFHLAAAGSVLESIEKVSVYHDINVTGMFNVLLAAKNAGVARFVLASSASVYGDTSQGPNLESQDVRPMTPYAANKAIAEAYCMAFFKSYGMPTVIFRFFNVYGPRQNPRSSYAAAIPTFIKACQANEWVTIFGDGEQTRDFVYVGDVVETLITGSRCDTSYLGIPINVASGQPVTINHVAQTIRQVWNSSSRICHKPPRSGDIRDSSANVDRLRSMGVTQALTLREGLAKIRSHTDRVL